MEMFTVNYQNLTAYSIGGILSITIKKVDGKTNLKVDFINHKGRVEKTAKRSRGIQEGRSFLR